MSIARKLSSGMVSPYWIQKLAAVTPATEAFNGVAVDSAGNIIVTGYISPNGTSGVDGLIAKFDLKGALLWGNTLGGTGSDFFRGVAVDSANNIIAVGVTTSAGAGGNDCLIARYNSSGTPVWRRTLGGTGSDFFSRVAVDSANNIIAVGFTTSDGAGNEDCLIAKYNSAGTLQWDRTLGGTGTDRFGDVAVDSANNIIAIGNTTSDGAGNNDGLIAKYNSAGTLQWDRTLGGTGSDVFNGVAVDSANNIIAVGVTTSAGAGGNDCLIARYNSSGTLLWQRTLGGTGSDFFNGVAVDSASNIIAIGVTTSDGAGNNDGLIAKYNSSGTPLWRRTLGGTGSDFFSRVAVDSAGDIIIGGQTGSDGIVVYSPSGGLVEGFFGLYTSENAGLTSSGSSLTNSLAVLTDSLAVLTVAPGAFTTDRVGLPA